MLIRELLNEYELDAVESILDNRQLHKGILEGKQIVCLESDSNSLTRTTICLFLGLNEKYYKNISVYLVRRQGTEGKLLFPKKFYERADYKEIRVEELSQIKTVEYLVDPGFCNHKLKDRDLKVRKEFFALVENALQDKKLKRLVLLSDYRSYQKVEPGVMASEQEYKADKDNPLKNYEESIIAKAKALQASYIILRSAIALGGEDFNSHQIHELISRCGKEEEITLYLNPDKYSFVYLTDLLGALLHAMTLQKQNEIYNVTGAHGPVTTFEIGRILAESLRDSMKIKYLYGKEETAEPIALDSSKLYLTGFTPVIEVQDGLEMAIKASSNKDTFFLFHDTYNGKLSAIQQLMLKVIIEIDTLCKKHNIKYFLGGGTLLGAIRHQGFIPWDDDADIMMLREDYDRFVEVAEKELPDYLELQTAQNDKNNHFFSKVRIKGTVCATEFTKKLSDINVGFFVDIFPHDYTANSRFGQKLHQNMTVLARSLVYNKWNGTYVHGDGSHKVYRFFASILKTILPMRFLEWQQFKIIEHYKYKKNRRFLYDGMGQNLKKGPFPKEWLEETIYVPFESVQLPVPKDYDKYLTHLYGDYMHMIGVSKRKNSHNIYLLDLGPYLK